VNSSIAIEYGGFGCCIYVGLYRAKWLPIFDLGG
jgi:hypothetical protein